MNTPAVSAVEAAHQLNGRSIIVPLLRLVESLRVVVAREAIYCSPNFIEGSRVKIAKIYYSAASDGCRQCTSGNLLCKLVKS